MVSYEIPLFHKIIDLITWIFFLKRWTGFSRSVLEEIQEGEEATETVRGPAGNWNQENPGSGGSPEVLVIRHLAEGEGVNRPGGSKPGEEEAGVSWRWRLPEWRHVGHEVCHPCWPLTQPGTTQLQHIPDDWRRPAQVKSLQLLHSSINTSQCIQFLLRFHYHSEGGEGGHTVNANFKVFCEQIDINALIQKISYN